MEVLDAYEIKVAGIQEVRCMEKGQYKVRKYTIYFSGMEERQKFGCKFAVYEEIEPFIKEFNPISEGLSVRKIDTKPRNIALICTYALIESADENNEDTYYECLVLAHDKLPENAVKMVLEDLNAKFRREMQISPTVEKENLHETSNRNGLRLLSFVTRNSKIISSTTFSHKKIKKGTIKVNKGIRNSPDVVQLIR